MTVSPPSPSEAPAPPIGHRIIWTPRAIPKDIVYQLEETILNNDTAAFKRIMQTYHESGQPFDVSDLFYVWWAAISKDNVYAAETLLSHGMKVYDMDVESAASSNAKGVMGLFIKNGWELNKSNRDPAPPSFTRGFEHDEMAFFLLDHGADMNFESYYAETPLSSAVQHASPGAIRELLRRGGDVQKGELLQHALDRTSDVEEVLRILLEHGAPLNVNMYENHTRSMNMWFFMDLGTPLHKAATQGNLEAVRLLLDHGADPTIKDNKGRTALEYAVKAGHSDVVKVLRHGKL
ncbi:hypothetical protein ACRALDRAFT_2058014 [Sodiomyces alcalophilus JCM 7366]|uniref:uncharacterized protein n=1 Tax=Sodiomyces alcalophilus JCM 7366 TaxID=591952 RepID=UPI0039B45B3F